MHRKVLASCDKRNKRTDVRNFECERLTTRSSSRVALSRQRARDNSLGLHRNPAPRLYIKNTEKEQTMLISL